jgi:uncharacterized membrane protein
MLAHQLGQAKVSRQVDSRYGGLNARLLGVFLCLFPKLIIFDIIISHLIILLVILFSSKFLVIACVFESVLYFKSSCNV